MALAQQAIIVPKGLVFPSHVLRELIRPLPTTSLWKIAFLVLVDSSALHLGYHSPHWGAYLDTIAQLGQQTLSEIVP
jgi:hypothetical protein